MANMTTFPTDGKNIIKGQPFSVLVSISGEPNITDTVEVSANLPSGMTLLHIFPGKVTKGTFSQQLILQASESKEPQHIKFTSDSLNKAHTDVTYIPADNPDLDPDTCALRGSAVYLYDPNPVEFTGADPGGKNPFISASINPTIKKSGPVSNYDIPLRTTAPLRIFTEDMTEIYPYKIDLDNLYYYYLIQKASKAAVNLKIYATKSVSGFVELDTIFNDEEFDQKQVIFVTAVPTDIAYSLEPPEIEETLMSSTLTRPDEEDEFTVMVPHYEGAKIGNFIIGFTTDDKEAPFKQELFAEQITGEEDGYYKFKAAYSDLYSGDNHLCFVALDQTGTPVRSKFNYINYDNGGINGPNPNDEHRTLVAPKVYDQYSRYIGIYNPININSIGTKGLEVRLQSDVSNPEYTIAAGDMITIKVYISHCVDTQNPKRPLPIVISDTVQSTVATVGYYKTIITPDKLMGYEAADEYAVGLITIEYSRLAQGQKSKLFTRSFGTVAPGEGN
ncbi:hypothetical protein HGO23_14780 [Xenorhabdus budapestensis]|uniref:IgGFc-binding protein N-terminal domain-containing protein n=1 Tax=Xenorhabdus budapestensis TaxID=290110 RepID=A0ABX7VGQ0_XENBU|nr:hypothetical protein [Xenorhabdus budapestensis]QTL39106.1 hypothetical protein HGO23_14780 [Xenorhabdus budapestensis]